MITTAWANHLFDLVNNGTAPPALSGAVYLRLFTDDPGAAGSFADEVTGGTYTGQDITAAMGAPTGGAGSSGSSIVFTGMPAATVTHWAKCRTAASTTGSDQMIECGELTVPVAVPGGDTLTINTGDIESTVG